ncbi:hypothetical protein Q2P30_004781 [Escherichia coli]|nr:hypothetical protein [Escherichia coli]ELM8025569.1 hypothetical protein [Escherichia coli]
MNARNEKTRRKAGSSEGMVQQHQTFAVTAPRRDAATKMEPLQFSVSDAHQQEQIPSESNRYCPLCGWKE